MATEPEFIYLLTGWEYEYAHASSSHTEWHIAAFRKQEDAEEFVKNEYPVYSKTENENYIGHWEKNDGCNGIGMIKMELK